MTMPYTPIPTTPAARQHGTVLVVSLIMLLLLTMLGLSSMRGTTLEERMAGNMRDQNLAFQAAEAALREGEAWLAPLNAAPAACAIVSTGCNAFRDQVLPDLTEQDADWWATNALTYSKIISYVATAPLYLREEQAFLPDDLTIGHGTPTGRDVYQVTARGTGQTDDAEVLLQTTYYKRFN